MFSEHGCVSLHLTDFSGLADDAVPEMNTIDPVEDVNLLKNIDNTNIVSVGVILGGIVLYTILSAWGWRVDRRQYRAWKRERRELRRSLRVDKKEARISLPSAKSVEATTIAKIKAEMGRSARKEMNIEERMELDDARRNARESKKRLENLEKAERDVMNGLDGEGVVDTGAMINRIRDMRKSVERETGSAEKASAAAWGTIYQELQVCRTAASGPKLVSHRQAS